MECKTARLGLVGLAWIALWALAGCTQWTEEQRKRQSLPDFQFEALDGGTLGRSDLPADRPCTIMFYDPDCSHCKESIDQLLPHLPAFNRDGNTLVLVSPADRSQVVPYLQAKGLQGLPIVKAGLCTPQQFLDTFGTTQTPTTLFYGADWDLKMAYKGEVDSAGYAAGLAAAR